MKYDAWNPAQRKPDDTFVDNSLIADFKPTMGVIPMKRGKDCEFKPGALEADVFFAELEDEIKKVADLMTTVQ